MTMQPNHSPKPHVFGPGYGAHLAYNFGLVRTFTKLAIKVFINAFVPGVYYEEAHWKIIDLYYQTCGRRHGTNDPKRCDECGSTLEPRTSAKPHIIATLPEVKSDTTPEE